MLETPCPHCGGKLGKPYKSGSKTLSLCSECGKKSGVKINANNQFEIYRIGRRGNGLIHRKVSLPAFCDGMSPDEIRRLVEIGKKILDKRVDF